MADSTSIWTIKSKHKKKTRQGMGRGTKWGTKNSKKYYKKKHRGQGGKNY